MLRVYVRDKKASFWQQCIVCIPQYQSSPSRLCIICLFYFFSFFMHASTGKIQADTKIVEILFCWFQRFILVNLNCFLLPCFVNREVTFIYITLTNLHFFADLSILLKEYTQSQQLKTMETDQIAESSKSAEAHSSSGKNGETNHVTKMKGKTDPMTEKEVTDQVITKEEANDHVIEKAEETDNVTSKEEETDVTEKEDTQSVTEDQISALVDVGTSTEISFYSRKDEVGVPSNKVSVEENSSSLTKNRETSSSVNGKIGKDCSVSTITKAKIRTLSDGEMPEDATSSDKIHLSSMAGEQVDKECSTSTEKGGKVKQLSYEQASEESSSSTTSNRNAEIDEAKPEEFHVSSTKMSENSKRQAMEKTDMTTTKKIGCNVKIAVVKPQPRKPQFPTQATENQEDQTYMEDNSLLTLAVSSGVSTSMQEFTPPPSALHLSFTTTQESESEQDSDITNLSVDMLNPRMVNIPPLQSQSNTSDREYETAQDSDDTDPSLANTPDQTNETGQDSDDVDPSVTNTLDQTNETAQDSDDADPSVTNTLDQTNEIVHDSYDADPSLTNTLDQTNETGQDSDDADPSVTNTLDKTHGTAQVSDDADPSVTNTLDKTHGTAQDADDADPSVTNTLDKTHGTAQDSDDADPSVINTLDKTHGTAQDSDDANPSVTNTLDQTHETGQDSDDADPSVINTLDKTNETAQDSDDANPSVTNTLDKTHGTAQVSDDSDPSVTNTLDKTHGTAQDSDDADPSVTNTLDKTHGTAQDSDDADPSVINTLDKTHGTAQDSDDANPSVTNTLDKTHGTAQVSDDADPSVTNTLDKTHGTAQDADDADPSVTNTLDKTHGTAQVSDDSDPSVTNTLDKTHGTAQDSDDADPSVTNTLDQTNERGQDSDDADPSVTNTLDLQTNETGQDSDDADPSVTNTLDKTHGTAQDSDDADPSVINTLDKTHGAAQDSDDADPSVTNTLDKTHGTAQDSDDADPSVINTLDKTHGTAQVSDDADPSVTNTLDQTNETGQDSDLMNHFDFLPVNNVPGPKLHEGDIVSPQSNTLAATSKRGQNLDNTDHSISLQVTTTGAPSPTSVNNPSLHSDTSLTQDKTSHILPEQTGNPSTPKNNNLSLLNPQSLNTRGIIFSLCESWGGKLSSEEMSANMNAKTNRKTTEDILPQSNTDTAEGLSPTPLDAKGNVRAAQNILPAPPDAKSISNLTKNLSRTPLDVKGNAAKTSTPPFSADCKETSTASTTSANLQMDSIGLHTTTIHAKLFSSPKTMNIDVSKAGPTISTNGQEVTSDNDHNKALPDLKPVRYKRQFQNKHSLQETAAISVTHTDNSPEAEPHKHAQFNTDDVLATNHLGQEIEIAATGGHLYPEHEVATMSNQPVQTEPAQEPKVSATDGYPIQVMPTPTDDSIPVDLPHGSNLPKATLSNNQTPEQDPEGLEENFADQLVSALRTKLSTPNISRVPVNKVSDQDSNGADSSSLDLEPACRATVTDESSPFDHVHPATTTHTTGKQLKGRTKNATILEEFPENGQRAKGIGTPSQTSTIQADEDPQWSSTHHSQIPLDQLLTSNFHLQDSNIKNETTQISQESTAAENSKQHKQITNDYGARPQTSSAGERAHEIIRSLEELADQSNHQDHQASQNRYVECLQCKIATLIIVKT